MSEDTSDSSRSITDCVRKPPLYSEINPTWRTHSFNLGSFGKRQKIVLPLYELGSIQYHAALELR